MPAKVDELFKEIKKDNPSYSDEQAWATAWSVFCKHVSPGSDHCKKPTSEYLKGKNAMNSLILRVAARYLSADEGEEDSSNRGVPARWQEWIEKVHQGGKKKVPNPNPETRDRYKEVSFSTALKNKQVFQKALKDYREWAKKNPAKDDDKPATKSAPKSPKDEGREKATKEAPKSDPSKESKGFKPSGELDVTDEQLDAIIKRHKKDFDDMAADMKDEAAHYAKSYGKKDFRGEKVPQFAIDEFHSLSEQEKMLHVSGHWVGELFEKTLSKDEKELHELFTKEWANSSSNPTSMQVQGALSSMGVGGYAAPKDREVDTHRDAGKKRKALKEYLSKAYAFTQAYFKHIGLKEMTLYRGVMDKSVTEADEGEDVQMETRELSSFTSDPKVAARFGRPMKTKVPVKHILWSNLNAKELAGQIPPGTGEAEFAVMGASGLVGKTIGQKSSKHFDVEDR